MNITPYLFFDGNCRQAFEFYAACLGVKVERMLSTADIPADAGIPADTPDKIMHARIDIGGHMLMGSDECGLGSAPFVKPAGFRVSINVDSVAEAERVFQAMSDGGHVDMPLEKSFFAARFGMLTDQFGIGWMINCEKDN